jgi:hypothetical protein
MSWAAELRPAPIRLSSFFEEVRDWWIEFARYNLTPSDRVGFVFLRFIQRVSYSVGWYQGTRRRVCRSRKVPAGQVNNLRMPMSREVEKGASLPPD